MNSTIDEDFEDLSDLDFGIFECERSPGDPDDSTKHIHIMWDDFRPAEEELWNISFTCARWRENHKVTTEELKLRQPASRELPQDLQSKQIVVTDPNVIYGMREKYTRSLNTHLSGDYAIGDMVARFHESGMSLHDDKGSYESVLSSGKYVTFERVGDFLLVLAEMSDLRSRHVYRIDLKTKLYTAGTEVPKVNDGSSSREPGQEPARMFLTIGGKVFVAVQNHRRAPFVLFAYDFRSRDLRRVLTLQSERPRLFLGFVRSQVRKLTQEPYEWKLSLQRLYSFFGYS